MPLKRMERKGGEKMSLKVGRLEGEVGKKGGK
jgi:hypothetical protein